MHWTDYRVALDLHLYFYTLRTSSPGAGTSLKYYYSNPLNYEPKLHLIASCTARSLRHAHKFAAQSDLSPSHQISRSDASRSVLQRFPNAGQL